MNNEPVAWIANDADLPLKEDGSYWLYPKNPSKDNLYIPLYTHQYERPHNTVLVPCDKLKEMQEKLTKYELRNEEQRNRIAHLEAENNRLTNALRGNFK